MDLEKVLRLKKDIRDAAANMSQQEARYLVDMYYIFQKNRIASAGQVRALNKNNKPNEIVAYSMSELKVIEDEIKKALLVYANNDTVGKWALSICGIGPVLAAGLLAHIDIEQAPTAGHIWSFAGLDPTKQWSAGKHRPWNAALKVLCWKLGQSFVKVSSNENDVYGKIWSVRKAYEQKNNEAGKYKDQAAAKLEKYKIGKDTEAYQWYSKGMLPPAHIQQRTERYAVKLFLSHYHYVAYREKYGVDPPRPFAIDILGHAHEVPVPNYPLAVGKVT